MLIEADRLMARASASREDEVIPLIAIIRPEYLADYTGQKRLMCGNRWRFL